MTLPASGAIALSDVLTELRVVNPSRALPISLGDADVRALAGVPSGSIGLSDLYGKRSYIPMSATLPDVTLHAAANPVSTGVGHPTVSITVSDGLAPFSYAWTRLSGSGTVNAANAASITSNVPNNFTNSGDIISQVVQCVVTDGLSNTITRQCNVTLVID